MVLGSHTHLEFILFECFHPQYSIVARIRYWLSPLHECLLCFGSLCLIYITYLLFVSTLIHPRFFFGGISITHLFICLCYLLCLSSFCFLCLLLPISVLSILLIPTAVFSSVYAYMDIMIFSRALFPRDTSSYLLTCGSSCCML